ncbi:MAG: sodium:alanine symporter family protein [Candidatus Omnitrophota bacterium]
MNPSNTLLKTLSTISDYVWGTPMIVLLLGTGVFLTLRLGFLQITHLPRALKLAFSRSDEDAQGDISHFKALMTALAATIGIGNIVGVASAIAAGGPGALFWMWVTALFGMATKYSEAILAVKYRIVDEKGEMVGGPMFALERGLGMKWLGVLFAIFGSIAAFGIGNMAQANAVAAAIHDSFNVSHWFTGIVMVILTAAVILGGIKRIGETSAIIVPFMAVFYIITAAVILIINAKDVPHALALVFTHAFTPTAAVGGFMGALVKNTIQSGVSRGLFSNESGLGSAPIAAAAAKTKSPKRQALVSMTGTFLDTIVVCTMTGLVIIATGVWTSGENPALLTAMAFEHGFPGTSGDIVVTIGLIFFAYSTILGWSYYGEKCVEYLFGVKAVFPYRLVWVVFVMIGSLTKIDIVWVFSDIMNALMAIPNLIALIFLSGVIVEETRRME